MASKTWIDHIESSGLDAGLLSDILHKQSESVLDSDEEIVGPVGCWAFNGMKLEKKVRVLKGESTDTVLSYVGSRIKNKFVTATGARECYINEIDRDDFTRLTDYPGEVTALGFWKECERFWKVDSSAVILFVSPGFFLNETFMCKFSFRSKSEPFSTSTWYQTFSKFRVNDMKYFDCVEWFPILIYNWNALPRGYGTRNSIMKRLLEVARQHFREFDYPFIGAKGDRLKCVSHKGQVKFLEVAIKLAGCMDVHGLCNYGLSSIVTKVAPIKGVVSACSYSKWLTIPAEFVEKGVEGFVFASPLVGIEMGKVKRLEKLEADARGRLVDDDRGVDEVLDDFIKVDSKMEKKVMKALDEVKVFADMYESSDKYLRGEIYDDMMSAVRKCARLNAHLLRKKMKSYKKLAGKKRSREGEEDERPTKR